jgi:hypothetical protein
MSKKKKKKKKKKGNQPGIKQFAYIKLPISALETFSFYITQDTILFPLIG